MALLIGWLGGCSIALADEKYPDGMTILETPMIGEMQVVTGSKVDVDVAREPASTFKVVIAWAALDRGLVQDVEAPLKDANPLVLRYLLIKTVRENTLYTPKLNSVKVADKEAPKAKKSIKTDEKKATSLEDIDKSIDELVVSAE